jgi:hypothetical protein
VNMAAKKKLKYVLCFVKIIQTVKLTVKMLVAKMDAKAILIWIFHVIAKVNNHQIVTKLAEKVRYQIVEKNHLVTNKANAPVKLIRVVAKRNAIITYVPIKIILMPPIIAIMVVRMQMRLVMISVKTYYVIIV